MPMYKKSMLILLMIIVAAMGGTYYGLYDEQQSAIGESSEPEVAAVSKPQITVYVTGGVEKPGVVQLPEGARGVDAVNACGGLLPTADSDKVNLAQVLQDGQQLRIPERKLDGSNDKSNLDKSKATAGDERVNLNTADEKALDTLPGIGPAMAKRIIEYRETEGAFQSIEDIKKIRGIGEAKFAKLKEKICI